MITYSTTEIVHELHRASDGLCHAIAFGVCATDDADGICARHNTQVNITPTSAVSAATIAQAKVDVLASTHPLGGTVQSWLDAQIVAQRACDTLVTKKVSELT